MHRETQISNYILAAFSALALIMLSLPLSAPVRACKAGLVYLFNPAVYCGAQGLQRLADTPPGLSRLLSADLENVRLRAQLRQDVWQLAQMDALREQNQRFARALGLKPPRGYAPLWGEVLERDPLHWYSSIMVSIGATQGVPLNAPVLGEREGALVAIGRVTEVRRDSCVVLLLTDESSSAAAYLSSAAVEGLVQGEKGGGPRLSMNYLAPEVPLVQGDLVYTSATSATFPGHILIGSVAAIQPRDPAWNTQSVAVQPALDAASLSQVMILTPGTP
jgi:rod shape-determining protein MreC